MKALGSLRARVAALVVLAVAVVVAVVGTVSVASFAAREHQTLDQRLGDRPAQQVLTALRRARTREDAGGTSTLPLLRGGELFARVSRGGRETLSAGVPDGLAVPPGPGLRTLSAGGERYRVRARSTRAGALVEVGTALSPTEDRIGALRTRVLLLSIGGVVVAGALAWWLAGLALAPLTGLRAGAERVSSTRDLSTRLPTGSGGEEVDAVSASVNAMLGRLERSAAETDHALEATRRFAADAGHEVRTPLTALRADLATLARNPDLPEAERRDVLAEAEAEAARAARLLESLQLLARGDAGASLPRAPADLGELIDSAIERARRRHPRTTFALQTRRAVPDPLPGPHSKRADEPEMRRAVPDPVVGWVDGLASLVENVLENAALHGRPGGRVEVSLRAADEGIELTVDDDGPGVPVSHRERLFERFARGTTGATGSGLGLALVRQQARLHGGDATIEDSPLGGARLRIRLAAQSISEDTTAS